MARHDLALFRAFPALEGRCPRHPVTTLPTPVEPFPVDGVPAGRLFVKRDDLCSPLYGGNKPRKLEFILGAAVARGARRLVTTGGIGTHHGLATAILGRDAGMATTLVLIHQPVTAEVQETLRLFAGWGVDLLYGGGVAGAALQVVRAVGLAAVRGESPFYVATGGSSTRGAVGLVSAGLELAEQVRAGALPEPAELYVAVGTGGTLAGLVAGLRLGGLATRVVGVLVTDILPPGESRLARQAGDVLAWLRRRDPGVPAPRIAARDFELAHGSLGGGYGAPTPEARDAVAAAAAAGLRLETTYTGKCLAEIRLRAARGALAGGPILFWNTFNAVDVAASAPLPLDPARLPPRFRAFLDETPGD